MNPKFTTFIVCVIILHTLIFSTETFINTTVYIGENVPTKFTDDIYINDNAKLINKSKVYVKGDLLKFGTNDTAFIEQIVFNGIYNQRLEGEMIKIDSLIVQKNTGELNVLNDINIEKGIVFNSGNVNNTLRTIYLAKNAKLIGENENSRIVGLLSKIIISKNLIAPNNENIGNVGATISTSSNLGNTQIERTVNNFNFLGISSAERYYRITTNNNNNLNAQLSLKYLAAELNGNNENTLAMYQSPDNGNTWNLASTNTDTTEKIITANGLYSLNSYTFADVAGNPLPIELLSFQATYHNQNNTVDLKWETQTETNNNYFSIEKSFDGINFTEIGTIFSKGNSYNIQTYEYTDVDIEKNNTYYYRLKQTDYDGTFSYSKIEKVKIDNYDNELSNIYIYPTLINNNNINIYNRNEDILNVKIIDTRGNILYENTSKDAKLSIPSNKLSDGYYYVHCQNINNNTIFTKKILNIK
jgi:hypothetical protein